MRTDGEVVGRSTGTTEGLGVKFGDALVGGYVERGTGGLVGDMFDWTADGWYVGAPDGRRILEGIKVGFTEGMHDALGLGIFDGCFVGLDVC